MRIPPDARIDDRKLREYLLVRLPRDDKSVFLAQSGFDRSNASLLRSEIVRLSAAIDAISGGSTPYGTKWLLSGTITGPNGGELPVKLVWIERLNGTFDFVTLVPHVGGKP